MELITENGNRIYMEETLDGVVARLYDENGILIEQREFTTNFLHNVLFCDLIGG